jgi:hypothetical protein
VNDSPQTPTSIESNRSLLPPKTSRFTAELFANRSLFRSFLGLIVHFWGNRANDSPETPAGIESNRSLGAFGRLHFDPNRSLIVRSNRSLLGLIVHFMGFWGSFMGFWPVFTGLIVHFMGFWRKKVSEGVLREDAAPPA